MYWKWRQNVLSDKKKFIHSWVLLLLQSSDTQHGKTGRSDQLFSGSSDWRCRSKSYEAEVELQLHEEDPQRRGGLQHPDRRDERAGQVLLGLHSVGGSIISRWSDGGSHTDQVPLHSAWTSGMSFLPVMTLQCRVVHEWRHTRHTIFFWSPLS